MSTEIQRQVLQGLLFSPRGGSAQVVRYLSRCLADEGWRAAVLSGSLGAPGELGHAPSFFDGLEVRCMDYTEAASADQPMAHDPPMHPSYEDRPGAPDQVFAQVDDGTYERLVAACVKGLLAAGAERSDVLHLHHLTPINEAALRAVPQLPVIGHLHGTELRMLEEIEREPHCSWEHATSWARRLRRWARECELLIVLSQDAARRVPSLLGVEPDRLRTIGNGVDLGRFRRSPLVGEQRRAHWRRWLVEEPRGWDASGVQGSISYEESDLHLFSDDACVLLYVGRFTEVKRIPLMIRAYARARSSFAYPAPLVIVGGHPGEWEGDHPFDLVQREGVPGVFFAGWRSHEELVLGLNAADLSVLASVHEQFGQVLIEAMACGLPPIAVDAHGPAEIVESGKTGWLTASDDEESLTRAMVEAVNDRGRREAYGRAAEQVATATYSWRARAGEVAELYEEALDGPSAMPLASGGT
jgi:glycosyltransferase involved in cell wall biosynthesis